MNRVVNSTGAGRDSCRGNERSGRVTPVSDPGQDALAAQLAEMRKRLLGDAAPAGVAEPTLTAAIEEITAEYADARVTSFIAVLVEREVRTKLNLRSHPPNRTP